VSVAGAVLVSRANVSSSSAVDVKCAAFLLRRVRLVPRRAPVWIRRSKLHDKGARGRTWQPSGPPL